MKRPSISPGAVSPVIVAHAQELANTAQTVRAEARRLRAEAKRLRAQDRRPAEERRLPEPWELLEARRRLGRS